MLAKEEQRFQPEKNKEWPLPELYTIIQIF